VLGRNSFFIRVHSARGAWVCRNGRQAEPVCANLHYTQLTSLSCHVLESHSRSRQKEFDFLSQRMLVPKAFLLEFLLESLSNQTCLLFILETVQSLN